jgi:hypothetical protein
MNVIGVYEIDLHVNVFGVGIFGEMMGYANRSLLIQQLFSVQGSPN